VAGEAGVAVLQPLGSEFVEMFVGVGAAGCAPVPQAAAKSPAIIFIDELDAIGRAATAACSGGHDEREQTLNQMLAEMDGFGRAHGADRARRHQPARNLDPAPDATGRFDRQVLVDRPDRRGREEILRIHSPR